MVKETVTEVRFVESGSFVSANLPRMSFQIIAARAGRFNQGKPSRLDSRNSCPVGDQLLGGRQCFAAGAAAGSRCLDCAKFNFRRMGFHVASFACIPPAAKPLEELGEGIGPPRAICLDVFTVVWWPSLETDAYSKLNLP